MLKLIDLGYNKPYGPICECDPSFADHVVFSYDEHGDPQFPFGYGFNFVVRNPNGKVSTLCNEDGNCWADDWPDMDTALRYCRGEIDCEGNEIVPTRSRYTV